jgi:phage terminase large subunit-like protein
LSNYKIEPNGEASSPHFWYEEYKDINMKYLKEYLEHMKKHNHVFGVDAQKAIKRIRHYWDSYNFRQDRVDIVLDFIYDNCPLVNGISKRVEPLPNEKFWFEMFYGFYDKKTDWRVIHELQLIVGRGNNKTGNAIRFATVQSNLSFQNAADTVIVAPSLAQAHFTMRGLKAQMKFKGSTLNYLYEKGYIHGSRFGMMNDLTNTLTDIKAAVYERIDGLNTLCNIIDEFHGMKEDLVEVLNQGSQQKQPALWSNIIISTFGTERGGLFDNYLTYWRQILDEEIQTDSIFPIIYSIDSLDDIKDENCWSKSNPCLDTIVEREVIRNKLNELKGQTGKLTEYVTKIFNFAQDAYNRLFDTQDIEKVKITKETANELIKSMDAKCVVGIDFSSSNDLTSVCIMQTDNAGHFYSKFFNFLPETTMERKSGRFKDIYRELVESGDLILLPTPIIDSDLVFDVVNKYIIDNNLFVVNVVVDIWGAEKIKSLFENTYGKVVVGLRQMPKFTSPVLKAMKGFIQGGKLVSDSKTLQFCLRNVVNKIDANNSWFLNKEKAVEKIDAVSALQQALSYFISNKDSETYFKNILKGVKIDD